MSIWSRRYWTFLLMFVPHFVELDIFVILKYWTNEALYFYLAEYSQILPTKSNLCMPLSVCLVLFFLFADCYILIYHLGATKKFYFSCVCLRPGT